MQKDHMPLALGRALKLQQDTLRQILEEMRDRAKTRREWVGILIAIFAVLISIGAAVFAGLQWNEARLAREDTRAYIGIELPYTQGSGFDLVVKGQGNSPARNVDIQAGCYLARPVAGLSLVGDTHQSRLIVFPQQELRFRCDREIQTPPNCTQDWLQAKGTVTYDDIFGYPHYTKFCIEGPVVCGHPNRSGLVETPFSLCKDGNSTDETRGKAQREHK
jgi:hypothetical protein